MSPAAGPTRFRRLELAVPDVAAEVEFWRTVLGLPAPKDGAADAVQAGGTYVRFVPRADVPVAHVAFNVPAGGLARAVAALDADVRWLADPAGRTRHRFPRWRAEAVYLNGPAGHLLELVEREDAAAGAGAGAAGVLGVSELGVVVPDVEDALRALSAATGLSPYGSPAAEFAALGDARGLLVLVAAGRPWYPEQELAAEPAWARAVLETPRPAVWTCPAGRVELECGPPVSGLPAR